MARTKEKGSDRVLPFLFRKDSTTGDQVPVVDLDQATTIADSTVTAGVTASVLLAAGARKAFRIRNAGPGSIAIGASGVTIADGAVVIPSGGTHTETVGASCAWYVIASEASTAVKLQTLT